MSGPAITREFYEAFQRVEFDRWDAMAVETALFTITDTRSPE